MKKKIFFIILPVALFAALVMIRSGAQKTEGETSTVTDKTISVRIQTAAESKSIVVSSEYPATVSADQEATVTAKTSGTITALNFDLGKYVGAGSFLAKIDDTGANLGTGENNLKSIQIQQLEIALKQAEENLRLARKNEDEDSTPATRTAKDLAKLQLENANISLKSALDSHNITSPISGSVVSKSVSVGDSVTAGQTIAVISKTNKVKLSFFVEQERVPFLKIGDKISVVSSDDSTSEATITNISPQADSITKRFQIDAQPDQTISFKPGAIISVKLKQTDRVIDEQNILLPLSAMNIAQNENYIFVIENNTAKKVGFEIVRIFGENAEIKADLKEDAQIAIEGSKLLKDGSRVTIQN